MTTYLDIDTLADLVRGCYERDGELAEWALRWLTEDTDAEWEDDCVILDPETWFADDGNWEVECEGAESSEEAAEQYVEGGDWGDRAETSWVNVRGYRKGVSAYGRIERVGDCHKITIDAEEPKCCDGDDHDWRSPFRIVGGIKENPGVWGSGGGVVIDECCIRCGCKRVTDTWAQDMSDGEQGLTSVNYEESCYADDLERIARKEGRRIGEAVAEDAEPDDEWCDVSPDWDDLDSIVQGAFREIAESEAEEAFDEAIAEMQEAD